jgi:hypothetical protein
MERGYTVREVARRYRIGREKVMGLIRRGELRAVNIMTSVSGKPRYVITPEALRDFEERHSAAVPMRPNRRRTRRIPDYCSGLPD